MKKYLLMLVLCFSFSAKAEWDFECGVVYGITSCLGILNAETLDEGYYNTQYMRSSLDNQCQVARNLAEQIQNKAENLRDRDGSRYVFERLSSIAYDLDQAGYQRSDYQSYYYYKRESAELKSDFFRIAEDLKDLTKDVCRR